MNKKFFSKIGFNYLIYGVCAIIFQIVVINMLGLVNTGLIYDYNSLSIISAICNYVLPLPILVYLMKKLDSVKLEKHGIGIKTFLRYVCITFTLMWIGNIIGLLITALIGGAIQTDISNPVEELINSTEIWINLLLISIIGPIFEEFIFRKILIDRTIKYGSFVSIILSAIIFGLAHGNLNQFFYAALMGGFFAYVYIKTGKLIYTIILHIIINLMGSVVSLLVAESAEILVNGALNPFDLTIVLVYAFIILLTFLVGLIELLKYISSNKDKKTEISLKETLSTAFINYGMVCFIGFSIINMIIQIIG